MVLTTPRTTTEKASTQARSNRAVDTKQIVDCARLSIAGSTSATAGAGQRIELHRALDFMNDTLVLRVATDGSEFSAVDRVLSRLIDCYVYPQCPYQAL
jgi:hypothetical protein